MALERTKWTEPGTILAALGLLLTVSGLVWSAATIAASISNLSSNFDAFRRDIQSQISGVQAQISLLPTQTVRLDAVEHSVVELRSDNLAQTADINALKQAQAVLSATMEAARRDLQALQDVANGRLPGQRR